MKDLISVIVPVYNVEEYLPRCINSIMFQTYNNLEIILVDDGSPDRCGQICDEFEKKDNRIIVIHKQNGGLSDARNSGISIARGKYIIFLDSDDWMHKECIDKLYNLSCKHNAEISVCGFVRTFTEYVPNSLTDLTLKTFSNIEALEYLVDDSSASLVVAWGKLYDKKLFDNIKYPFGKIHEDEFVAHLLIYESKKIVYSSEQLIYYWQRNDSITGKGFCLKNKHHIARSLMNRAEFFNEIGLAGLRDKTYKRLFYVYIEIMEHKYKDLDYFNEHNLNEEFSSIHQ
ncbi:MAG: glycosyltransferase [Erysipelothrix sp.]|nr:glycosyltransferase [Erysipelothrix sp.]